MIGPLLHTRSQRLAGAALRKVEAVATDAVLRPKYRTRAMSFPAMVMQAGLVQSVGFLRAKSNGKDDNEFGRYLLDLAQVLDEQQDAKRLHERAVAIDDLREYRLLTREVVDAAGWLKRFAQTLLKDAAVDQDSPP